MYVNLYTSLGSGFLLLLNVNNYLNIWTYFPNLGTLPMRNIMYSHVAKVPVR
jgi:hypothetical protein